VLTLSELQCNYGKVAAVRRLSLEVRKGELVSLIGANGAGKTTTLRAISGIVRAAGGRIEFEGEDITRASPRRVLEMGIGVAIGVGLGDLLVRVIGHGAVQLGFTVLIAMTAALLHSIDHRETHAAVLAERAFTRALGGTCHSPVAALARIEGDEIRFSCELLSADGRDRLAEEIRFPAGDLEAPAELARRMLADAPESIRILFEGP